MIEDYGLPKDEFLAQLEEYNGYVEAKNDEQFGKAIPEEAQPIVEPPFYITRRWPKVHHTMGGVKTDLDCRVLDVRLQPDLRPLRRRRGRGRHPRRLPPGLLRYRRLPGQRPHRRPAGCSPGALGVNGNQLPERILT